uniref:Uncharacterized protein n=1 Tax=Acrobeloides nanus TaxID=290746 RepID=A0A914BYI7_9BILA
MASLRGQLPGLVHGRGSLLYFRPMCRSPSDLSFLLRGAIFFPRSPCHQRIKKGGARNRATCLQGNQCLVSGSRICFWLYESS